VFPTYTFVEVRYLKKCIEVMVRSVHANIFFNDEKIVHEELYACQSVQHVTFPYIYIDEFQKFGHPSLIFQFHFIALQMIVSSLWNRLVSTLPWTSLLTKWKN
jgi:hypothetical protein